MFDCNLFVDILQPDFSNLLFHALQLLVACVIVFAFAHQEYNFLSIEK